MGNLVNSLIHTVPLRGAQAHIKPIDAIWMFSHRIATFASKNRNGSLKIVADPNQFDTGFAFSTALTAALQSCREKSIKEDAIIFLDAGGDRISLRSIDLPVSWSTTL